MGKGKKPTIQVTNKGALWSIWKAHNDVVFEKKVLTLPASLVFKSLVLVKSWQPLLKLKTKPMAEEMLYLQSTNALAVV